MIRIGIVGDIGSGKSYIAKNFGYPVFNADYEVSKLYQKNRKVYKKLSQILPEYIYSFPIDKIQLTRAILANNSNLQKIIKVVHKEIRNKMRSFINKNKNKKFIILDIPLLLENKINRKNDILVYVESRKADIIRNLKKRKNFKVHNATKVFQALRIFVNKEISELIFGLINAAKVLKKGGTLGVVTFHSLEDKIVKYFFKSLSENKSISRYSPVIKQADTLFNLIQKKPITPSDEELSENPPSRSAKFRYAIKKNDFYDFDTDIEEQFRNYIEIENYGDKLWKSLL